MKSWAKVSVGLATFGFINMILFITLSAPIGTIFGMVEDEATKMDVDSDVTPILNNLRTVFGLTFVLSMLGLGVWFFFGSHEKEYEEY